MAPVVISEERARSLGVRAPFVRVSTQRVEHVEVSEAEPEGGERAHDRPAAVVGAQQQASDDRKRAGVDARIALLPSGDDPVDRVGAHEGDFSLMLS